MKRLVIITALTLPMGAAAQDAEEDKGYIVNLIEDNLSGDTRTVTLTGFAGALSSEATIEQLTVADSDGIWLTLDDVVLQWNRGALLRGAIDIETLAAARINVARAPLPDDSLPAAEATPFALPELPVSIALAELRVDRIELGPDFLGEPLAFAIAGAASLSGGEGAVDIAASRLDSIAGEFAIKGAYANASRVLDIALDLTEAPGGIAATQLGLPGDPSVALALAGNAPLDDFAATLSLATDGQDRIAGSFGLTQSDVNTQFNVDITGDIAPLLNPDYRPFFGDRSTLVATGQQSADGFDLSNLALTTQSLSLTGAAQVGASGWPERVSLNGTVANADGGVVLLPLSGPQTFVDRVGLHIGYDRAVSNDWTAQFDIAGFDRPGLYVRQIILDGGGEIVAGDGAAVGSVTANMTYAANGLELDDAGASDALGDQITGVFALTAGEGVQTKIERLTLTGPGLDLLADATIDGSGNGFETDANVMLSADALARFATLAGQPGLAGGADLSVIANARPLDGMFDVLLNGATRDLATGIAQLDPLLAGEGTLSLQAVRDTDGTRLEGLRIATDDATVSARADLTSDGSDAEFAINIRDLALVLDDVDGPATLSGTANRQAGGVTDFDITGRLPSANVTATGSVVESDAAPQITADISADVSDLATYATIAGRDLAGAIDLSATTVARADGSDVKLALNARTNDLRTDIAQLDPLLRGPGQLSITVSRVGDSVDLTGLRIVTGQANLAIDGMGQISTQSGATNFDIGLTDLALVTPDLSGPARVMGRASRSAEQVITFDVKGDGPAATFATDGNFDELAQRVTANALTATVTDLSQYRAISGQPLSGGVTLEASGGGIIDGSLFDVDLNLRSRDVVTGITQVDPLLRGAGTLSGRIARTDAATFALDALTAKTPALDLAAQGSGGMTGPAQADLALTMANAGVIFDGLNGPLNLTFQGQRGADDVATLTLAATASGATVDLDATVAAPADGYSITGDLNAAIADLRPYAQLAGQSFAGGLAADISGTALPDLSQINAEVDIRTDNLRTGIAQADQLLTGLGQLTAQITRDGTTITLPRFAAQTSQLSASGELATDGTTGRATFDARLAEIGLFTDQLSGPVTAGGAASLNAGGAWGVDVTAAGPGGIGAQANGTIQPGGNLNLALNGNLPLGLANDVLDPRRLSGDATFNLSVNGPPALSSVSGQINTNGARLAAPTLGQALSNISGGVTLTGGNATLGLTGDVQTGGQLQINGPVSLAPPFNGNISVGLNQIILRDPNLYSTSIDGTITANGPLTGGALISGVLTLGQTDVQVPSSGVGSLGELPDVVHIGEDGQVRQTLTRAGVGVASAETSGPAGPGFPLDVTINAPSRIFIRGRGLDAELGGSLNIGGTSNNIVPVGQFELIRGRIDILQQRFELDEGTASLQGDFIPVIRLVATTEAATGTVIEIVVEGPADAPVVTFQSTPDLPQDEVLSQLIFGRNLSEISPLQAVQLAAAVGTLAGRGGGGLIDNFRQNIGLDDFDVTTDDDGNAAVRAGAYLSENIYTDVTINAEGETEINLNLDVTSDITAKGTVDADGETSIGIFFERDY